jgi:protein SCO1/2
MRRSRTFVLWATAAIAIAAGAVAAYATLGKSVPPQFKAIDVTGAAWGDGFELTDHHGKARRLADFRGKLVLLFFGYTGCPDMCPTTLALLGESVKEMGPDADKVQGLFVTVDPGRDTPQVLAQYVPAFHPSFLGLYGDQATTERTAREFKAYFHANPPNEHGSYTVDHSGQVYVFDPAGRIRLHVQPAEATPESIAHDLRLLLHEAAG